jgi:hypothetical protein
MNRTIFSRLHSVFVIWHGIALLLPVNTLAYFYSQIDTNLFLATGGSIAERCLNQLDELLQGVTISYAERMSHMVQVCTLAENLARASHQRHY